MPCANFLDSAIFPFYRTFPILQSPQLSMFCSLDTKRVIKYSVQVRDAYGNVALRHLIITLGIVPVLLSCTKVHLVRYLPTQRAVITRTGCRRMSQGPGPGPSMVNTVLWSLLSWSRLKASRSPVQGHLEDKLWLSQWFTQFWAQWRARRSVNQRCHLPSIRKDRS
jgi:hypothetical protein